MTIVLASQSPRRRELLDAAGIPYVVRVAGIDEAVLPEEDATAYVRRVSRSKAMAVPCAPGEIVLAADTTVVCDEAIFGKPLDAEDAARMLRLLAAKRHEVITGICLRTLNHVQVEHETTGVWFGALTQVEIEEYVASGEPMDKAGAYAIQGVASRFIERIDGNYANVVGLPIPLVWRALRQLRNSLS